MNPKSIQEARAAPKHLSIIESKSFKTLAIISLAPSLSKAQTRNFDKSLGHKMSMAGRSSSGPYLPTGIKQRPYLINHEDSLAEGVQFFKLR